MSERCHPRPRRGFRDRMVDRHLTYMLGLMTVSRMGSPVEVDAYMITLVQRVTQGAKEGDC